MAGLLAQEILTRLRQKAKSDGQEKMLKRQILPVEPLTFVETGSNLTRRLLEIKLFIDIFSPLISNGLHRRE